MTRKEFESRVRSCTSEPWTDASYGADQVLALVDKLDIEWDAEYPDGFADWFTKWDHDGGPVPVDLKDTALAAWNACLEYQQGVSNAKG